MLGGRRLALLVATVIAAVAALAGAGPAPAADDPSAWLYQPDQVARVDLRLAPGARKALAAAPDEYVKATLSVTRQDGQVYGPLVVGLKLKGHSSFRGLDGKAAFKVKFGEFVDDQTFLGLRTMVLNNMVQDPTMLHEVLAYEAFRAAGLPSWRTGYAFVRINGQAYGVYLNLESPDAVSLARWYPTTRHLYEGGQGIDLVRGDTRRFSVEEGDEDHVQDLGALISAVSRWKGVGAVADLGEMTRFWAVEKYIGHWDGYSGKNPPNNYYLHSDAAGRFTMLPWGTDQTWTRRVGYGDPGGAMFNRCLADSACLALYRSAVEQVRGTLAGVDLQGLATRTAAMLRPWQRQDPRRESTLKEADQGLAALGRIIAARRTDTFWHSPRPARVEVHTHALGGGRLRVSGSVQPRHDGSRVQIQRRDGTRFRVVATTTLVRASASRSRFAVVLRDPAHGRYRVYLPADAEHLAVTAYFRL